MMRIRVAPQARADLDTIWLDIAREYANDGSAARVISSITDKFGLLSRFPYLGKGLESDLRPNVRIFSVNNYVIFYSVKSGEIRILRIIHTSRDAESVFAAE
jgi:toxin ParE1/3/4